MKKKESTFQLTNTTFFYATAPLRFSFECFSLRHSQEFIDDTLGTLKKKIFPPSQNLRDFIIGGFAYLLFYPIIVGAVLVRSIPMSLAELATGLLTIVPAMTIAIAALPVISLLALGEFMCSLISNSDKGYTETQKMSL
jgi:hypothetical protein